MKDPESSFGVYLILRKIFNAYIFHFNQLIVCPTPSLNRERERNTFWNMWSVTLDLD